MHSIYVHKITSVDFGEDVYGRSLEDDYAVSPTSGNQLVELVVTSLGTQISKQSVKISRYVEYWW